MVAKEDDDHGEGFVLFHLFFNSKFTFHRFLGLCYLCQYVAATYLYWTDYERFAASPFIWSLPLNGVIQSLTATYYFKFLRSTGEGEDPPPQAYPTHAAAAEATDVGRCTFAAGYYGDKGTLSHSFVKENIFYSMILMFQWLYMSDRFYPAMQKKLGPVVEAVFVFLPYLVLRPWFPKTSFRDSLTGDSKTQTQQNKNWFYYATWITK